MGDKTKKVLNFCYGFFGMLAVLAISVFGGQILALLVTIPLALIGFFLWLAFRQKNKMLAIGFLFGGVLPFAILFIATGGCGLVRW